MRRFPCSAIPQSDLCFAEGEAENRTEHLHGMLILASPSCIVSDSEFSNCNSRNRGDTSPDLNISEDKVLQPSMIPMVLAFLL